jgi:hypothetical protein
MLKVFITPLILKDNFAGCSDLGWQDFFLGGGLK